MLLRGCVLLRGPLHWLRINLVLQSGSGYLGDLVVICKFQEPTLADSKGSMPCPIYRCPQSVKAPLQVAHICQRSPVRDRAPSSSAENSAEAAALASSSSCAPACVQRWNPLFLHSSCSGHNNREIPRLVQPSTLLWYGPPAEKGARMTRLPEEAAYFTG